jgi:hypothetical protein
MDMQRFLCAPIEQNERPVNFRLIAYMRKKNGGQGQHHHVSPQYLYQYANHAAWLEDNRRTDNGGLAMNLVANAMEAPVSRNWKGYWQRAT